MGIPSVAAGYFYTASPVSLAYVALGELTVFVFMGPVIVLGAYFVMALHFSAAALWASIPLGFMVAGILHANNIRDIESDTRHSKRTLATILGRDAANYELVALDREYTAEPRGERWEDWYAERLLERFGSA